MSYPPAYVMFSVEHKSKHFGRSSFAVRQFIMTQGFRAKKKRTMKAVLNPFTLYFKVNKQLIIHR